MAFFINGALAAHVKINISLVYINWKQGSTRMHLKNRPGSDAKPLAVVHLGEELHGGLRQGKAGRPNIGQQLAHGVELVKQFPDGLDHGTIGLLIAA